MRHQHPPGDEEAAWLHEKWIKANDPNLQDENAEYDPLGLGPEPDFPGDER